MIKFVLWTALFFLAFPLWLVLIVVKLGFINPARKRKEQQHKELLAAISANNPQKVVEAAEESRKAHS